MKLYHVSYRYLGERVRLEPRLSIEARIGREPGPPRICVSDSIEGCLWAITKSKLQKLMYVYQALRPRDIDFDSPRQHVEDWEVTQEVWILQPTDFKFLYAIEVQDNLYTDDAPTYKRVRKSTMQPTTTTNP